MDFGRFHALVIGNDCYRHLLPLETAVNDARAVADLLRRRLIEADNLLIHYAGHGVIYDIAAVPPDLVDLWVRKLLNQAAQEQFWRQETAAALALRMRTTIARLAIGLPEINTAFKRRGMPDIPTTIAGLINWRTVDR